MQVFNAYQHYLSSPAAAWQPPREEGDILITPDGCRWRIERTPTVGDLVRAGDIVHTSYGTGGLVVRVTRHELCCCPRRRISRTLVCYESWEQPAATLAYHRAVTIWTIVYVGRDAKQNRAGQFYDERDFRWLNELVAVGARILALFENNPNEIFVTQAPTTFARPVQLALF